MAISAHGLPIALAKIVPELHCGLRNSLLTFASSALCFTEVSPYKPFVHLTLLWHQPLGVPQVAQSFQNTISWCGAVHRLVLKSEVGQGDVIQEQNISVFSLPSCETIKWCNIFPWFSFARGK